MFVVVRCGLPLLSHISVLNSFLQTKQSNQSRVYLHMVECACIVPEHSAKDFCYNMKAKFITGVIISPPAAAWHYFFKSLFPFESHFHGRSATPFANMYRVQIFTCDVSTAKPTRNMSAPTVWSCFPLCPLPLCLISYIPPHTPTHTHTHIFILDMTAKQYLKSRAPIPLLLFFMLLVKLSFALLVLLQFPPRPSITLQRSHPCHLTFKTKYTCVSEGTAVWGQVNLDF